MYRDPLSTFRERLPWHGFATDDLTHGLRLYPAAELLGKLLIQFHAKHSVAWLCYDVDDRGAYEAARAPAPNLLIENPANEHCHVLYGLDVPVHNYAEARPAPQRFMAAVDIGLTALLGADPGYSKLICKNPFHPTWRTYVLRHALYDLAELADWMDLTRALDRRRNIAPVGFGRNCRLFEQLRRWSYRERRQPWLSEELFREAVLRQGLVWNADFAPPLPHAEVRAIAKSTTRWVWRRMSDEGFSAWQRKVGALGNAVRQARAAERNARIIETRSDCPTLTQDDIAALCGCSRWTVYRAFKTM